MLLSDDTPCHYDSMKNPTDFTCSNGAGVTYSFDYTHHTNRLLSVQTLDLEQEVLASYGYVYDDIGNATTITDLSGPTTYAYDALYQLTNATRLNATGAELSTIGYGYDGFGNRTSVTQTGNNQTNTYDPGNELTHGGPSNLGYGYDQAGNMTSAGSVNYSWDALDRMTKISASPAGPITYVYDGDNLRVRKLSAGTTINYFYDGHSEVLETDGNGNVLKSFNPGIRMTDKQNNKLYYLFNGHGDVTGLMDANEELVQSYSYDPYGTTIGTQKDPNNMRYVGSGGVYSDDDAGLQYMVNRWYNPILGRFVSRDPIGFQGGMNLYCYTGNNPINGIDLIGLCQQEANNSLGTGLSLLDNLGSGIEQNATQASSLINDLVEGNTSIRNFYNGAYGTSQYSPIALPENGIASSNISNAENGGLALMGVVASYEIYEAAQLPINQQSNAILNITAKTEGGIAGAEGGATLGLYGYGAGPVVGTITTIGSGAIGAFLGTSAVNAIWNH